MPPRKRAAAPAGPARVEAIEYDDSRVNIPTGELREFAPMPSGPPPVVRYARDPSLDPQLVWKGKDEQDSSALEVPSVPIYVQEKVDPRVIVENLRRTSERSADEPEATLFDDFDGLEFDRLVDFYSHGANWSNRMILGDSLLAMNSLADKEAMRGKVQMIYMDPPYGIKFGSNWQVSTRKRDVKDGKADDATRQPEQVKAFRDTWELGIHSYLSYLRDRLKVARELLTESGSVFVQIGDENVHLVRSLLDEVFGSENFCSSIVYKKTTGAGSPSGTTDLPSAVFDHLLWYARNRDSVKYRRLWQEKRIGEEGATQYNWVEDEEGRRTATKEELRTGSLSVFAHDNMTSQSVGATTVFPVTLDGRTVQPLKGGWKTNEAGMRRLAVAQRLMFVGNSLRYVRFFKDFSYAPRTNLWEDTVTSGFGEPKVFVVQTHTKVITRCLLMTTDPGDLVLDPTCGSGTTA